MSLSHQLLSGSREDRHAEALADIQRAVSYLLRNQGRLGDGAVDNAKLEDGSVTEPKLGTGAVTEPKVGTGAVTETKLGAAAVTNAKLGPAAVTEPKLGGGSVTKPKIGYKAVDAEKLTVAAPPRTAVFNGNFEDAASADATLPARWRRAVNYGGNAATAYLTTLAARSGTRGVRLVPGAGTAADLTSDRIPVNAGEVWALAAWARQQGTNAGTSPGCYAGIFFYNVETGGALVGAVWAALNNAIIPATWARYLGQATVPTGATWAEVVLLNYVSNTGATLEYDEVELVKALAAPQIEVADLASITPDLGAVVGGSLTDPTVSVTDAGGAETFAADGVAGTVKQGKRANASSVITIPAGTVGWTSTGLAVTIPVATDTLVKVFVEVEATAPGNPSELFIGLHEAGDFATPLQVLRFDDSAGAGYFTRRTGPGTNLGVSTAVAGEITIRPSSSGTKTYTVYYRQDDANLNGGGLIRARRIYAYTT